MRDDDGADVVRMWVAEPPSTAVRQGLDRLARAPDVLRVAVMPDVHVAAGVNNGVALATRRLIYPAAVGADIGCGFATVAFDAVGSSIARRSAAEAALAELIAAAPIMRHRRRDGLPELDGPIACDRLSADELASAAARDGRLELGTLGRGNHFLELQRDASDRLWAMVHSGSRAMGQHIMRHHLRGATSAGAGLAWLDADTDVGRAYLADVAWARAYAAESRLRMLRLAAERLADRFGFAADWSTLLNTDHNHVQREEHGGELVYVHRKGANVAAAGQANVIPGSMATRTYHVEGRGEPAALGSSSHGAGRRLSRGAARAKIRRKDLQRELSDVWVDASIVNHLIDESPSAYKDLDAVMRAQRELVRITARCVPIVCHKGV